MIKKLCSYPGCHKVVEAGVKYCSRHKDTDRKKYREYKQQRMRDEEEARRQQFYNSKAWELFRAARAAEQLGIDIYEYYTTGKIIAAENYHHIEEITETWARRLDAANVIGISEANHRNEDCTGYRSLRIEEPGSKEDKLYCYLPGEGGGRIFRAAGNVLY